MGSQSMRLLLIEDNPGDARLVREVLRDADGVDLHVADRLALGLAHLASHDTDVVLLDLGLPDSQGLDTVRAVASAAPQTPIVVLTGLDDEHLAVEAVRTGAQDYLVKGEVSGKLLLRAARHAVERKRAQEEIASLARFPAENPNPVLRLGRDGTVLLANPASAALLGTWGCGIGGCAPEHWRELVAQSLASRESRTAEALCEGRAVSMFVAPVAEMGYANLYGCDVTERKQAELRERHLNQVLRAVRNVNQLIVREKDPKRLVAQACETLIETRGYRGAWIALAHDGAPPWALAGAGWGEELESFTRRMEAGIWPPCREKALASEQGLTILCPKAVCQGCPLGDAYGENGAAVVELRHGETSVGLLGISMPVSSTGDAEERSLLLEVAGDLAYALHGIENEARRRETEERFRLSFDNASIGEALTSPGGRLARVNRALCDLLGYTRDELEAKGFAEITYPDDMPETRECVRCLLAGERTSYRMEKRYLRKDGPIIWADVSTVLQRDEAGRPLHFITHVLDITERKRSDRALQESKQLVDSVVESVPLMIFLKEAQDLRFVVFNRAGEDLLGYDRKDLLGKNNLDLFPPEQAAFFMAKDREVLAGGVLLDIPEEPILTAKKGTRLLHTRKVCIKGADGVTRYLLGISEDITERKQAEEALRASEGRFRAVFQAVTDGILVADVEGAAFVMTNRAMCGMLGYSEEELLRLGVKDIHPPEHLAAVGETFRKMVTGEQSLATGVPFRRKDGSRLFADVSSVPLVLGGRSCLLGVFRDMTAFNEMEEQMRQSQKMEAFGQLAGGVAHDFNNLLGIILGHCDLALRELREDDPLFKSIHQIQASGDRAAALTRQLLAFSRKQTLQPAVLVLNVVLAGISSMLLRLIGEDIDLVTVLAEDLWRTMADPGQIEQVVINLAVNARDAMPQGGKLILETRNVEVDRSMVEGYGDVEPGSYVLLVVTDTGHGMDQDTKSRVFEPFFTTKEKDKGTGLGLSTVYGIVRQSGGYVTADSAPGQGTTFKVYLPRTDETVGPAKRHHAQPGELRGQGEVVLLVEDEQGLREILHVVLEDLGYRVSVAANGGEALLAVEEAKLRPDLLITDVVMPGISGLVLAKRLRKTLPDLKVLYMSGYTDGEVGHHGILDPGTPLLEKPFKTGDLVAKINELLRGEGHPDA